MTHQIKTFKNITLVCQTSTSIVWFKCIHGCDFFPFYVELIFFHDGFFYSVLEEWLISTSSYKRFQAGAETLLNTHKKKNWWIQLFRAVFVHFQQLWEQFRQSAFWWLFVCWIVGYNMLLSYNWAPHLPQWECQWSSAASRFRFLNLHHVYGGLSTFTQVALAVKHLWNKMSGFGSWLSQSSFLLMKCFLNLFGPIELVVPALLVPSLTSLAENQTIDVKTFLGKCTD